MKKIFIKGKEKLFGNISINGMKNSALPVIFATLLVNGETVIENIPRVSDIQNALTLLSKMGAVIRYEDDHTVRIRTEDADLEKIDMNIVSKMRASSYLMGAILAKQGNVSMVYPGGCNFGCRPIDEHLNGFTQMGAKCIEGNGYVEISTDQNLKNGKIILDKISVGATINMVLASVFTKGKTEIINAAMEPHVDDVIEFLDQCGADIRRVGNKITVCGVNSLKGVRYKIFPDMIEALTYMSSVGVAGGALELDCINIDHLMCVIPIIEQMGMTVKRKGIDTLQISSHTKLCGAHVKTSPYPGFPTDFHPQFASLLCYTNGGGSIDEQIFPGRFAYVNELKKMGGRVDKTQSKIIILPSHLKGSETDATDLRAGAALIVASLGAEGISIINNIGYILRGYEDIVGKLSSVGADIKII